jgi:tetratricopeptide (TPR) repeat protein
MKGLCSKNQLRLKGILGILIVFAGCALPSEEAPSERVLTNDERRGLTYLREGLYYYNRNRLDEAEERFLSAEHLYPNAANIQTNLAITEGRSGDVQAGLNRIADLELEDKATAISVYAARGLLQRLAANYPAACNAYTAAYELALEKQDFPSAAAFAQSLASLYFLRGDEHEAWCWQEIVEVLAVGAAKKNVEDVVRLMMAAGQYHLAYTKLETYFITHPGSQDVSLLSMQGLALLGMDKKSEALSVLQSLMLVPGSRSNQDPVISMLIAYAEGTELDGDGVLEAADVALKSQDALIWPKGFLEYLETQLTLG